MTAGGPVLRVAQLVETLDAGGAEALAVDIAGALAERGHASHLIVARGDGPFRARVARDVVFHDLERPRRDGGQFERLAYFAGTSRRLEAYLRSRRIDVLQTHLPKANFLGLAMAWRGACRVFPTVHNNREFDYGDDAGALKRRLRRAAYRNMLERCRAVIAVSDQVRASLAEQLGVAGPPADRIRVVPNGVRLPVPPAAAERARRRAEWGMADGQVLLVGVGRLTRQKDFATLLAALAGLPAATGDWRCVIAGDGELRPELERQLGASGLAGRVRLAGLVDDVPGLLAAADVFCLPSAWEGLPLVLLEAMAAGLPTAAFRIAGVADVVADGGQALLATPGDKVGYAAALATLIADAGRRRELGEAARQLVATRYGFAAVIANLEGVYRS